VQSLSSLLVGRPIVILGVSLAFVGGFLALRVAAPPAARRPGALLVPAGAWALYAAWERLVQARTPEANIRADLLLIWPVLAVLSVWALFRVFR
jgi:protein-S-isoprenylcysteine O-methyltransferase Ste14